MQASLIQEFPRTDHSKSAESSRKLPPPKPEDTFKRKLYAELQSKDVPIKQPSDEKSNDLEEMIWASGPNTPPLHLDRKMTSNEEKESHPQTKPRQTENVTAEVTKSDKPQDSKTSNEIKESTAKKEPEEKQSGGKNVSTLENPQRGEAKNAPRPSLNGSSPLTYGTVKTSENLLVNAGNTLTTSASTIPVNHGTPHASGVSSQNEQAPNHKTRQLSTMSDKSQIQSNQIKGDRLLDGSRGLNAAGNTSGLSEGTTSFGSGFSSSDKDESQMHSSKDFGNNIQLQAGTKVSGGFASGSSTMVDSIRKIQSMIQEQIVFLRSAPGQSMQVMIRPDANKALFLTLQQNESDVAVAAKMDQATSNLLKPHWEEIQKELSNQGIRLGNPELNSGKDSPTHQQQEQDSSNDNPQNFLSNRKQESDQIYDDSSESSEISEPDFDHMEGTLVSWA